MKVTNTGSQQLQGVVSKKSEKTDSSKNTNKQSAVAAELSGSSEVALSQRAKDMKKIKEVAMKSSPDVDEAKVARFQKLIDSGKYKVDSKAIADRLVDEELKMARTDTE